MEIVKFDAVSDKIIHLRGERVILDRDIADLYGVETRDINTAVKNNPEKFPQGYFFQLNKGEKSEVVENFHHLEAIRFSPHLPKAFTEKGLYMLATILKGPRATQTTISIIETFAKLKNLTRTIKEISAAKSETEQKALMEKSGNIISELLDDELDVSETETSIELNFAVLKLKHTISVNNLSKKM